LPQGSAHARTPPPRPRVIALIPPPPPPPLGAALTRIAALRGGPLAAVIGIEPVAVGPVAAARCGGAPGAVYRVQALVGVELARVRGALDATRRARGRRDGDGSGGRVAPGRVAVAGAVARRHITSAPGVVPARVRSRRRDGVMAWCVSTHAHVYALTRSNRGSSPARWATRPARWGTGPDHRRRGGGGLHVRCCWTCWRRQRPHLPVRPVAVARSRCTWRAADGIHALREVRRGSAERRVAESHAVRAGAPKEMSKHHPPDRWSTGTRGNRQTWMLKAGGGMRQQGAMAWG